MSLVIHNLSHSLMITMFVFVMMLLVDYINIKTNGKAGKAIKENKFKQYLTVSFLGAIPGCLGSFLNVSFYVHGLISFGAIAGCMIATCGDEAFVMLAMFPDKAILLFGILFIVGVLSSYLIDYLAPILNVKPCKPCELSEIHPEYACSCLNFREILKNFKNISLVRFFFLALLCMFIYGFITGAIGPDEWGWLRITLIFIHLLAALIIITVPEHYLEEHIWAHIAKKHIWKVFLWTFGATLVVDIGLKFWNLEAFVKENMFWVLLIAALISIIPESGPHLIFVMMFSKGLIPFSVLLVSSIIQDGHGMLPLLSYTVKDSILIKLFNLVIGLVLGIALYSLGY